VKFAVPVAPEDVRARVAHAPTTIDRDATSARSVRPAGAVKLAASSATANRTSRSSAAVGVTDGVETLVPEPVVDCADTGAVAAAPANAMMIAPPSDPEVCANVYDAGSDPPATLYATRDRISAVVAACNCVHPEVTLPIPTSANCKLISRSPATTPAGFVQAKDVDVLFAVVAVPRRVGVATPGPLHLGAGHEKTARRRQELRGVYTGYGTQSTLNHPPEATCTSSVPFAVL